MQGRGRGGRVSFCDSQFVVMENENNSWIMHSVLLQRTQAGQTCQTSLVLNHDIKMLSIYSVALLSRDTDVARSSAESELSCCLQFLILVS